MTIERFFFATTNIHVFKPHYSNGKMFIHKIFLPFLSKWLKLCMANPKVIGSKSFLACQNSY